MTLCTFACRIDKLRSLQFISHFLSKREHLMEKAALFLAKAYIVYKVSRFDQGSNILRAERKGQGGEALRHSRIGAGHL